MGSLGRLSSGVDGLDTILNGGFLRGATFLIRGGPGQGKTTLGLHFLSKAAEDEASLFIGFQESDDALKNNALAVGLDTSNITFLNLCPDETFFSQQNKYDVFSSSEVESGPLSDSIMASVESIRPKRVFIDSLTQFRFLSTDVFQYRKEILSLLSFLTARGATVLFTSEHSPSTPDDDLQFLADGVISLGNNDLGQFVSIKKFRGSGFHRGTHQMRNASRGVEVYPRPVPPKEELVDGRFNPVPTGVDELDRILNGGLEQGTVTMVTGPSGIGKSTLASCIASETAMRVGHTAVYLFEEEPSTYLHRARNLGLDLDDAMADARLTIDQIEPLRYLADEFSQIVYDDVAERKTRMVVFDSTAGFQMTLDSDGVRERLHALAKSLSRMNVSVLLINETSDLYGHTGLSEKGISYLSDNVISINYDEESSRQQAIISVNKKRLSAFDRNEYRFQVGPEKVQLSPLEPVQ